MREKEWDAGGQRHPYRNSVGQDTNEIVSRQETSKDAVCRVPFPYSVLIEWFPDSSRWRDASETYPFHTYRYVVYYYHYLVSPIFDKSYILKYFLIQTQSG